MKLVLLDRDGVVNHDSPDFIKSAGEFVPIEGSIDAIARLKRAGLLVALCTNQSGIARGRLSLDALEEIHRTLAALLAEHGAALDALYYCPHGPDDGCACRKPKPGMLLAAMRDLRQPPQETVFIGDSARDLEAAAAAGCLPVLVRTGTGARLLARDGARARAARVFADLAHAADWLLET
jgi:D-glycero-D-manno-heptose 1,7-bisphosphate phosphatase